MNVKPLIPLTIFASLLTVGYYVDQSRKASYSLMSGTFENMPTDVAGRLAGRVAKVYVREGQTVRKGDPLVELEADAATADLLAKAGQAQAVNAQLLEALNGTRPEEITRQEGVVAEMQAAFAKLANGSRPEEVAQAKARYQAADAAYQKAVHGPRPEELAQAKAAAAQAFERLRQAQRGLTPEERAQAKARLDAAKASEAFAAKQLARTQSLYDAGATSKQELDAAEAQSTAATADRVAAEQAWRRADMGTPTEELAQARQAYNQAKAQQLEMLAGTRAEDIEAARAAMSEALAAYQLTKEGPRAEDIEAAKSRLAQAQATLTEMKNGTRPEALKQAKALASAANETLKGVRSNIAERTIVAPFDGSVDRLLVAVGDLVGVGMPVVRMANRQDIWVRVYLPESELSKAKVGDGADLLVDGVPGLLQAHVESIATQGEFSPANLQTPEERGKQVFAIRLRLDKPDTRVQAGMTATVKRLGAWRG